jgi:hypothetical protein
MGHWLNRQRQDLADEAAFWLGAIDEALAQPRPSVQEGLFEQMDRRIRAGKNSRAITLFGLPELARSATKAPTTFPGLAEQTKKRITVIRSELLRRLGPRKNQARVKPRPSPAFVRATGPDK